MSSCVAASAVLLLPLTRSFCTSVLVGTSCHQHNCDILCLMHYGSSQLKQTDWQSQMQALWCLSQLLTCCKFCRLSKNRMSRMVCRGLLAAAAEDDGAEGGAVNNLDSASAAGDSPEVPSLICLHTPAMQGFEAQLLSLVSSGRHCCSVAHGHWTLWAGTIISGSSRIS